MTDGQEDKTTDSGAQLETLRIECDGLRAQVEGLEFGMANDKRHIQRLQAQVTTLEAKDQQYHKDRDYHATLGRARLQAGMALALILCANEDFNIHTAFDFLRALEGSSDALNEDATNEFAEMLTGGARVHIQQHTQYANLRRAVRKVSNPSLIFRIGDRLLTLETLEREGFRGVQPEISQCIVDGLRKFVEQFA